MTFRDIKAVCKDSGKQMETCQSTKSLEMNIYYVSLILLCLLVL